MARRRKFVADPTLAAITVGEAGLGQVNLLQELGLERDEVLHVKARELDSHTFEIVACSPFRTEQFPDSEPFFVVGLEDGEYFTTVLGGMAVVQALNDWLDQKSDRPLEVTLRYLTGKGGFGGYYVFAEQPEHESEQNEEQVPF